MHRDRGLEIDNSVHVVDRNVMAPKVGCSQLLQDISIKPVCLAPCFGSTSPNRTQCQRLKQTDDSLLSDDDEDDVDVGVDGYEGISDPLVPPEPESGKPRSDFCLKQRDVLAGY